MNDSPFISCATLPTAHRTARSHNVGSKEQTLLIFRVQRLFKSEAIPSEGVTKSISTPLDRIQFTRHWMEINNNIFDQQWKIPVLHFHEQHAESRLSYVRQKTVETVEFFLFLLRQKTVETVEFLLFLSSQPIGFALRSFYICLDKNTSCHLSPSEEAINRDSHISLSHLRLVQTTFYL